MNKLLADRQRNRQANYWQIDRENDKQTTGRQTLKSTSKLLADRRRNRQANNWQIDREIHKQTTDRQTEKQIKKLNYKQAN